MQTFKPPIAVAKEGKKALGWLKAHKEGKGFTKVGFARAHQLAERKPVSLNTVKRMHSYFSRHEPDKRAEGFERGEKGYPSKGKVAWSAWGDNAGKAWADRIVKRERG
jgi:hypothetical protein